MNWYKKAKENKTAGWMDKLVDKLVELAPDKFDKPKKPYMLNDKDLKGQPNQLTINEYNVKSPDQITVDELKQMHSDYLSSDPDLLIGALKAIEYIGTTSNPKIANGLKTLLYKLFTLPEGSPPVVKAKDVLRRWYAEYLKNQQ